MTTSTAMGMNMITWQRAYCIYPEATVEAKVNMTLVDICGVGQEEEKKKYAALGWSEGGEEERKKWMRHRGFNGGFREAMDKWAWRIELESVSSDGEESGNEVKDVFCDVVWPHKWVSPAGK